MGLRSTRVDTAKIALLISEVADDFDHSMAHLLHIEETINGADRAVTGLSWHGDLVFLLAHLNNLRMQLLVWERDASRIIGSPDDAALQRRSQRITADGRTIGSAFNDL